MTLEHYFDALFVDVRWMPLCPVYNWNMWSFIIFWQKIFPRSLPSLFFFYVFRLLQLFNSEEVVKGMSSYVGVHLSDPALQNHFTQVELRSLKSKVSNLKATILLSFQRISSFSYFKYDVSFFFLHRSVSSTIWRGNHRNQARWQ